MYISFGRTHLSGNATDPEPVVGITVEEIEASFRLSGGPTVCRLEVQKPDGSIGRFWLSVTMKRGRPEACLTAHKKTRDMNVTAIADWADDRRKATTATVTH